MRLLVVGGNPLLGWIVQHLVSEEVVVELTTSPEAACRTILDRPPDAVLVRVIPKPCPCREVVELCRRQRPPIPVLYHSGAYLDPAELGVAVSEDSFSTEPGVLRRHLERLIDDTRGPRAAAVGSRRAGG